MTVRDRSINAGLAASTETSAMTAPEASLACPEIVLCADAAGESSAKNEKPAKRKWTVRRDIENPLSRRLPGVVRILYPRSAGVKRRPFAFSLGLFAPFCSAIRRTILLPFRDEEDR